MTDPKSTNERKRDESDVRAPYERPQLTKKRSVSRVTLFSGSGGTGATAVTSH